MIIIPCLLGVIQTKPPTSKTPRVRCTQDLSSIPTYPVGMPRKFRAPTTEKTMTTLVNSNSSSLVSDTHSAQ